MQKDDEQKNRYHYVPVVFPLFSLFAGLFFVALSFRFILLPALPADSYKLFLGIIMHKKLPVIRFYSLTTTTAIHVFDCNISHCITLLSL